MICWCQCAMLIAAIGVERCCYGMRANAPLPYVSSAMIEAAFSPIMIVGAWVQALSAAGMIEASAARSPCSSTTRKSGSQAAIIACHAEARTAEDANWASCGAMPICQRSCIRRLSSSTARSPSAWPRVQTGDWRSWTAFWASPRSKAIACCQVFRRDLSISSAAMKRRAPRSKRPRGCQATDANRTAEAARRQGRDAAMSS